MVKLLIMALALGALNIYAQGTTAVGGPDYFVSMEACKDALITGKFSFYEPVYFSNHKPIGPGESVFPLPERGCVEMDIEKSRNGGRGFVPQEKGTKLVRLDKQDKPDQIDFLRRFDCGNRIYDVDFSVVLKSEVEVPKAAPVQVAPYTGINLANLEDWSPMVIPPLPHPPAEGEAAVLVYEEDKVKGGKRWWWKYTPLWCVDIHRKRDLYRPAVCAAIALGGYWLAGGFSGGSASLIKIPGIPGGAGILP